LQYHPYESQFYLSHYVNEVPDETEEHDDDDDSDRQNDLYNVKYKQKRRSNIPNQHLLSSEGYWSYFGNFLFPRVSSPSSSHALFSFSPSPVEEIQRLFNRLTLEISNISQSFTDKNYASISIDSTILRHWDTHLMENFLGHLDLSTDELSYICSQIKYTVVSYRYSKAFQKRTSGNDGFMSSMNTNEEKSAVVLLYIQSGNSAVGLIAFTVRTRASENVLSGTVKRLVDATVMVGTDIVRRAWSDIFKMILLCFLPLMSAVVLISVPMISIWQTLIICLFLFAIYYLQITIAI